LIEAPVRDGVVVFDGRVLEVFSMDMSLRWMGSVMPRVEIDGDMLKLTLKDTTIKFWFFDDAQRPQVEALVAAVSS
jgi:hypothetical protein